ncbi:MAG TPA: amidohydrolase family protein [Acidobacteriaceae bacterium]|jgi:dihydroorotase|nr:amidohydrolase family protein [Acidobacteriaceae bacterium]
MLRVEGRIANDDREFVGAIEIDTETGLIAWVGRVEGRSDLDTESCIIFPGFGDLHVHAREDFSGRETYKEDFASASAAAIHGGVTHFADMPNNPVAPIDDASYAAKEQLTAGSEVHITLYGGIGPGTRPLERRVPYKAFMGPSVGELFFSSAEQLEETIARYRGCNVSFHCEDPLVLDQSREARTHEARRPAKAEISATRFALQLIERYELIGKLCHFSTGEGMRDVIAAKARGVRVTCEVTPHHLFFDDTMLTDDNRLWLQMNPPLRGRDDRLAMIEALHSGAIDYLATDHAPHTADEKQGGISGVPHLDTYGAFATWLMVEQRFSSRDIARVCASNPGKFVAEFLPKSFGRGFGRVEAGYAGSVTILDLRTPYTVTRESLQTKCGWSPFEGVTFPGSVRYTVINGRVHTQTRGGGER